MIPNADIIAARFHVMKSKSELNTARNSVIKANEEIKKRSRENTSSRSFKAE
jgi:hypothetical protein